MLWRNNEIEVQVIILILRFSALTNWHKYIKRIFRKPGIFMKLQVVYINLQGRKCEKKPVLLYVKATTFAPVVNH